MFIYLFRVNVYSFLMWPLRRGGADGLSDLARQCQNWDRELAKSEALISDFERFLTAKSAILDDFEESLNKIEKDQLSFEYLISNFESAPPPPVPPERDLLDDAKSLYQSLNSHAIDLLRMRKGPRSHRELIYGLADLEMAGDSR
jgi:hypothetical protein